MSTFTMGGASRYPEGGKFATATPGENIVPALSGRSGKQALKMARIYTKQPTEIVINGEDYTTQKAENFNYFVAEKHGVSIAVFGDGGDQGTIRSIVFQEPAEYRAEFEV